MLPFCLCRARPKFNLLDAFIEFSTGNALVAAVIFSRCAGEREREREESDGMNEEQVLRGKVEREQ